jgi:hypothetical protein
VHEGKGIESKLRATRQGIICMSVKRKELEENEFTGE